MAEPFDVPLEVRRLNWGWFGEPWPSGVCYDDDGRLIEEMRKPFPAGETCPFCEEPLDEAADDSGQAMPFHGETSAVRHIHKECMLRSVVGSLAHLRGQCSCHGGDQGGPQVTARQDALAVWDWIARHGVSGGGHG